MNVSTELVPLLRLHVLPPDIQQAVMHLSKLDRTPLHRHSSSLRTLEGEFVAEKLQTAVVVPAKKKRGRPAKISHKVDEGKRMNAPYKFSPISLHSVCYVCNMLGSSSSPDNDVHRYVII
jgi:hypothetical protein